jgi:ligand-binding sensor domain-containing protein
MLSSNMILSLHEDKSGMVWVGTGKGLDKIDPENGKVTHIYPSKLTDELSASYIIRHIAESRDGFLWIGTDNGLIELDPATNTITSYRQKENDSTSLPDNTISYVTESGDGIIWIGTVRDWLRSIPGAGNSGCTGCLLNRIISLFPL